jgi:hypothetical protein
MHFGRSSRSSGRGTNEYLNLLGQGMRAIASALLLSVALPQCVLGQRIAPSAVTSLGTAAPAARANPPPPLGRRAHSAVLGFIGGAVFGAAMAAVFDSALHAPSGQRAELYAITILSTGTVMALVGAYRPWTE